jgi:hypothetical protein|nr:MAG TPA: hypothetical protein [Caudoviricetes sp.]
MSRCCQRWRSATGIRLISGLSRTTGQDKPMARLNVEVIPPDSEALNGIFAEIERKYARQPLTPKVIDEMQREATRLVRRMITTKVTFVRD